MVKERSSQQNEARSFPSLTYSWFARDARGRLAPTRPSQTVDFSALLARIANAHQEEAAHEAQHCHGLPSSLPTSVSIEYVPVSSMVGATAGAASRFGIHPVSAFDNIADPLPERGDAGEVIAKGARWARNRLTRKEIITPGVIID